MDYINPDAITSILIVDDSSTSRMIIQRCLDMTGFTGCNYYFAENGLEAMEMIQKEEIELIVTDINMPKMDGKNFVIKIKNDDKTKNIPIIVASTMGGSYIEDELKKIGVDWIIKKPVVPGKLLQIIGE